ncbi:hypothetical protein M422DRAFT_263686 [Sphaerobolus stellatus SS14]|uniref:Fungal-type protein kinase domain-containing protein n=1 Tax=Sphaerobolus stellatus (strain SS14) TaxID=990650 RepID=A0A0C9V9P2_SPHS4|nr:hypothetical protein M422DRAFT_263686 [Sphaerobolus stellatus SS14]
MVERLGEKELNPPVSAWHRVQSQVLISTQGKPLTSAKGPKQLLQGVLHAMLGHWVLFKAGWLHRDISIGNVLLMMEPEARKPIEEFELGEYYFNKCNGFIIDGDLAGTPPFMSISLINSLVRGGEIYHTPLDDLESFVWVLLWAILDTLTKNDIRLTRVEQDWFNCLRSNSFEVLRSKGVLINDLPISQNWSPRFLTFVPLLNEWLDLAAHSAS